VVDYDDQFELCSVCDTGHRAVEMCSQGVASGDVYQASSCHQDQRPRALHVVARRSAGVAIEVVRAGVSHFVLGGEEACAASQPCSQASLVTSRHPPPLTRLVVS